MRSQLWASLVLLTAKRGGSFLVANPCFRAQRRSGCMTDRPREARVNIIDRPPPCIGRLRGGGWGGSSSFAVKKAAAADEEDALEVDVEPSQLKSSAPKLSPPPIKLQVRAQQPLLFFRIPTCLTSSILTRSHSSRNV